MTQIWKLHVPLEDYCFDANFRPLKIRLMKCVPELKMPRLDLLNIVVLFGSLQSFDHRVKGEKLLRDVDVLHHHKAGLS